MNIIKQVITLVSNPILTDTAKEISEAIAMIELEETINNMCGVE